MASRKQKKRRSFMLFFIGLFLVVFVLGYYWMRDMHQQQESDYGQINEIDLHGDLDEQLNEIDEDVTGEPLRCVTFKCGDALSVLIDIGSTEVLYDAGYAKNGKKIAKKLSKYVDGKIDYLILSHSHADHVGGVPAILDKYDVGDVIVSGEEEGSSVEFDAAMQALKDAECNLIADKDMNIDLGNGANLNIVENLDPGQTDNANDLSVIAHVAYGEKSILITGDAEKEAERALIGKIGEVTLLIAGHHMSSTSNSALLLKEWQPKFIFVSCKGKGSDYGFPHKAALRRCLLVTDQIYATFKSGDLTFETDGSEEIIDIDESEELTLKDCPS